MLLTFRGKAAELANEFALNWRTSVLDNYMDNLVFLTPDIPNTAMVPKWNSTPKKEYYEQYWGQDDESQALQVPVVEVCQVVVGPM